MVRCNMRFGWAVLAALLFICTPAAAWAADFMVFDGKAVPAIAADTDKAAGPIAKAGELLARDVNALTGMAPSVVKADGAHGPAIIIGQIDSPLVARLLTENHIDTTPLKGKWETYGRAVIPAPHDPKHMALLIFGSDMRGTIFGVTDLSREMGVSPWEWWADVTIRKVPRIAVDGATRYSGEPSVRYRAIFLNDEDFGLKP